MFELSTLLGLALCAVVLYALDRSKPGDHPPIPEPRDTNAPPSEAMEKARQQRAEALRQAQLRKAQKDAMERNS